MKYTSFILLDVLVCLVTMDAECFGPEALSEVQIFEKRTPTPIPSAAKPQSTPVPGYYQTIFDIR